MCRGMLKGSQLPNSSLWNYCVAPLASSMVFISSTRKLRLQRLIKSRINRHNQILQYSEKEDRLVPYYWWVKFIPLSVAASHKPLLKGLVMRLGVYTEALVSPQTNSMIFKAHITMPFHRVSVAERL
jgi:hypothetical protein